MANRLMRMVVFFGKERKYSLLLGPANTFEERQKIRAIESRVHLALHGENILAGLGSAHPDDRMDVRLEEVFGYDERKEVPVKPENVLVEQMIEIMREKLWAPNEMPKPKWTIGSVLKSIWQNFVEFLDDLGERAQKNPELLSGDLGQVWIDK